MSSVIRQMLLAAKIRRKSFAVRGWRRKKTSVSTRQWLILVLGVSTFVGSIFILAILVLLKHPN
jgi:hypothetical protein